MTLSGLITMMRPLNSTMVGFAVIVGMVVSGFSKMSYSSVVLGFLTGFFISSYSMIINDRYDIDVDRVNNPSRPLVKGSVSIREAEVAAVTLLVLGLATSTLLGWLTLLIAALFALIAWLYNYRVKRYGLLGNMLVSASVAIPYIYGAVAIGAADEPLIYFLALTSFLAGLGREVVKTICDVKGDEIRDVKSVARVWGAKVAAKVSSTFFILAILTSLLPLMLRIVGLVYGVLVSVPICIFVALTVKILRDSSADSAYLVKRVALLGMLLGLIAFMVGGYFRW
ncbi:MAG: UbiA family prenyltransferase [Thaumarchaeota archaeon]|nr:UbiA family prenyltransferase [Nitrososphaerota archaeon]